MHWLVASSWSTGMATMRARLGAKGRGQQWPHEKQRKASHRMSTVGCRADQEVGTLGAAAELGEAENVVIVGSGPAGYTAAIYTARANLKPLVVEGDVQANVPGGQLMTTNEVENYPGFPEGIAGPKLMDNMRQQAERFGAEVVSEDVVSADLGTFPFVLRGEGWQVEAKSVIIASGASAKRLNLEGESALFGRRISTCAICDGAAPQFKGGELAIVGGGDSAAEEAVFLTKFSPLVHMIVRSGKLRASKHLQDRVLSHPRVRVHYHCQPKELKIADGNELDAVVIESNRDGSQFNLHVAGLFYAIGHTPNTEFLQGQIDLDDEGYVQLKENQQTSKDGVFVAGDVHDRDFRQAVTAAGTGCQAAITAERWLAFHNLAREFSSSPHSHDDQEEATVAEGESGSGATEEFDPNQHWHWGQYALRRLYHESDKLLCVMFTAKTCGPCARLKPILHKALQEREGRVHFVEIDIEDDPDISQAAGVTGTPCVQFFYKKDRVANLPGMRNKSEYRGIIEQYADSTPAVSSSPPS